MLTAFDIPTPASLGSGIVLTGSTLFALGAVYRYILRPSNRGWKKIKVRISAAEDVVNRELTHNGGASMKDAVHEMRDTVRAIDSTVDELEAEQGRMRVMFTQNQDALEAIAQVLDNIVERKQEDHDALWEAIGELGGDRRHPERKDPDGIERQIHD